MAAGVLLAWLIDPIECTLTIYRPRAEPEVLLNPTSVIGEDPVEGFVLDLNGIVQDLLWVGMKTPSRNPSLIAARVSGS